MFNSVTTKLPLIRQKLTSTFSSVGKVKRLLYEIVKLVYEYPSDLTGDLKLQEMLAH